MKRKKISHLFFKKNAIEAAKAALGKYLVRRVDNGTIREGKIVEVEAYIGPQDRASHAYQGKLTQRNRAEFLEGGHIYIYLVYGMYWQLNITTGPAGHPQCFLIRAIEPTDRYAMRMPTKQRLALANGPGKLCRYFNLDKSFYGENITTSKRIWIEDNREKISQKDIIAAPRIGIDYAGPYWARRKLRFYIKGNNAVSKVYRID